MVSVGEMSSVLERGDHSKHSSSLIDTLSPDTFSLDVPDLSTSVLIDSNFPYYLKKAIFTFLLPNYQIIIVNSAACQLLNYTSEELCEKRLDNLIHECHKPKLLKLLENCLKNSNSPYKSGKLVDFVCAEDEVIPVYLYLKKLENSNRYVAVAEPLRRKTVFVTVDEFGKILSCDEETAFLFQYDSSDLIGISIHSLLPAINLFKNKELHWKPTVKQSTTGKTKNGETFPVCLSLSSIPSSEIFKIMILVYPNLSGIILLNKALTITNFNPYFIKLLFGVSKQEIFNQPITNLIPTFYKDTGLERDIRGKSPEKNLSYNFRNWFKKNDLENLSTETTNNDSLNGLITETASLSLNKNLDFKNSDEAVSDSENSFNKLDILKDGEKLEQGDTKTEINTSDGRNGIDSNIENILVREGKFLGCGKHCDGSYIKIQYQIRIVSLSKNIHYCVWISRDVRKFQDLSKDSTNAVSIASLNSTSIPSLDEANTNSISSEQCTRPSTASIISQCDDNLKAGEYSHFYTNIKGIGKGAFGYVKMAYRNSDGLLVVTKFIKKQKINVRSWVFNSLLNMKIPLEISLLMSLQHPNIVKVLDVFHNESYVQLVMEKHGAGFDLFEFISRRPKCDEKLKSYIFRQIVSAVAYLDSLGILHRDIKDENVIINEKFKVKLIDFGSATFMPLNESFSNFYGTVQFCSPEVLKGNSYKGPELEIWTLGVTLYVLTFGEIPFYNFEETIKGQFSIPSPISKELNQLLLEMLDKNIETRITIDKVVEDPWITQPVSVENYSFEEVVQCYDDEAYPPKYVFEIKSQDFGGKGSSERFVCTNDSDGSLQNIEIDELGDFDENFEEKETQPSTPERKTISPTLFSSTPLETKSKCRKSIYEFNKGIENSSTLSDYSCDSLQSISPESELNFSDNFTSNVKCDSSDFMTPNSNGKIRFRSFPEENDVQSQETSSGSENHFMIKQESLGLNTEYDSE